MATLFHSLVVIGAGISASACGSATNFSSGGTPDVRVGSGVAGASNGGTGGAPAINRNVGAAGSGPSSIILPDAETIAQWDCTDRFAGCSEPLDGMQVEPYSLGDSCPIDPTRPRSAADCASDEWFRCMPAKIGGVVVIAVNCECVPMLDAGCSCDGVPLAYRDNAVCIGRNMMCGCAHTGILVH